MKTILILAVTFFSSLFTSSQRTVGLKNYVEGNTEGYVLFSPIPSFETFLLNKCGEKVHQWTSEYRPGQSCYLLEDGNLLRSADLNNPSFQGGGSGGGIEKYSWDGSLLWSYLISDDNQCQHHDIRQLPNGNVLAIVWDKYTLEEALAMGRDPQLDSDFLWSEKIMEIEPLGTDGGTVVWEWKLWDHLIQDIDTELPNYGVVSEHPELMNINYIGGVNANTDWVHLNGIDYNAELDQILLSVHNFSEVWILDHSTTTAEAALHEGGDSGHGGDLLYRWGNPIAYQRGLQADKKFFGQHHATWIPDGYVNEGKIMVFNNGLNRPAGNYSSIDIIDPPVDADGHYPVDATAAFEPNLIFWSYINPTPTNFYAQLISGVYPLLDGSLFITHGPKGQFFEINPSNEEVWRYVNPVSNNGIVAQGSTVTNSSVFRSSFYPVDFPAFNGQTLESMGEIELNPYEVSICDSLNNGISEMSGIQQFQCYPNPTHDFLSFDTKAYSNYSVSVFDLLGETKLQTMNQNRIDLSGLSTGSYIIEIRSGEITKRSLIIRE